MELIHFILMEITILLIFRGEAFGIAFVAHFSVFTFYVLTSHSLLSGLIGFHGQLIRVSSLVLLFEHLIENSLFLLQLFPHFIVSCLIVTGLSNDLRETLLFLFGRELVLVDIANSLFYVLFVHYNLTRIILIIV